MKPERSKSLSIWLRSGAVIPCSGQLFVPAAGNPDGDMILSNIGKPMFIDSLAVELAWSLLKENACPECTMTGNPKFVGIRLAVIGTVKIIVNAIKKTSEMMPMLTLPINIPSSYMDMSAMRKYIHDRRLRWIKR